MRSMLHPVLRSFILAFTFSASAPLFAAEHVELAPFRPKAGVPEARLLAAVDAMQASLRKFPGFIRRETVRLDDGTWLDIVRWNSREAAKGALALAERSPQCQAFFGLIEETATPMTYGDLVRVQRVR